MPAVRDPHLRSTDVVSISVAAGDRRDGLEVRSSVRFREADTASRFALCQPWQKPLLLVLRTELCQHITKDGVRSDNSRKSHPPARELLKNHRKRGVIDFATAVLFGNI